MRSQTRLCKRSEPYARIRATISRIIRAATAYILPTKVGKTRFQPVRKRTIATISRKTRRQREYILPTKVGRTRFQPARQRTIATISRKTRRQREYILPTWVRKTRLPPGRSLAGTNNPYIFRSATPLRRIKKSRQSRIRSLQELSMNANYEKTCRAAIQTLLKFPLSA